MAAINILKLPQVVSVVMASNPAGMNMITSFQNTRSDFKIFWNVRNDIDFFIRDYDRRIQSIPDGRQFVIVISHPLTSDVLLKRPLTTVVAAKGHCRLTLTSAEATAFPIGYLTYTVLCAEAGEETIMFTDRDHGPQSRIEVTYGPVPAAPAPLTVPRSAFMLSNGVLLSGPYGGPVGIGNASGVQSVQITGSAWTGSLFIDASLDVSPPIGDGGWFEVGQTDVIALDGNQVIDFTGPYTWVRFRLLEVTGTLTTLLYRN